MRSQITHAKNKAENHTILSEEERHAIRILIERYKQTGKTISLKELDALRAKRKSD